MNAFSDSYVSKVLLSIPTPTRSVDTAASRRRWRWTSLFDPYRPEQHYMRGPGPKWREKHAHDAKSTAQSTKLRAPAWDHLALGHRSMGSTGYHC
jgi:hypothetical protein